MLDRALLEPVTIGTSGLGKRPGADEELAAALIASPFRQLDTGNNYALGRSEQLLGEAIAAAGGLPAGKVVFSKADQDPATGVFDGDRVRRSFDETTARLGLDTLPLYHLHDPYTISVSEAMAPGGPVEALLRLRDEGRVGAIGIAAGRHALVEEYVRTDAFDVVLSHNRWTLVDRTAETILQLATERDMTVFNAAPFGGGILAGSAFRGQTYGYEPTSEAFRAHLDRVRTLCGEWGVSVAAAALAFSLREPRIHSTVVGIYSEQRLDELPGLMSTEVPEGFWTALDALGDPPASPTD
ncbi:aldo/keto reductase [Lysinimonas soli]|uniref:Aldo/keto reductase n=1 Tax=Lysinimonas soli TaxID=1074233 RepID=A0ABW0NR52_9MICO